MKKKLPIALAIAGSDSGGGAGIQADLKTFAALGVYGTSAIACITAQNPKRVLGIQACTPELLQQQMEAVFAELPPAACKTGMLLRADHVELVAEFFSARNRPPLVVDPVMIASSGASLITDDAIAVVKKSLLPIATLATPNLAETEVLLQKRITSAAALRDAARAIYETFGCAALVKGGHLKGSCEAIDFFYDGRTELMLTAPFIRGLSLHGTGCTYSAAITACLARGESLPRALTHAKDFITQAIAHAIRAGKHDVLNSSWCRDSRRPVRKS